MIRFARGGSRWKGRRCRGRSRSSLPAARDGQLIEFPPAQGEESAAQLPAAFKSYSQAEIRGQLLREFGQGYEVSGVGHYLVVHPAGQRDQWAPRFEELYRSFVHYFAARGWQLTEPRFPLVAVVYPRQADFRGRRPATACRRAAALLGYYSPTTNRILMFDVDRQQRQSDWTTQRRDDHPRSGPPDRRSTRASTAASASRRGGSSKGWARCSRPAACGNRGRYPHQADRINRGRLQASASVRRAAGRPADAIAQLVSSDRPFQTDPDGAYAEAWALSFFLMRDRAQEVLRSTWPKRPPLPAFAAYRAPQRLKDFTDIFGSDLTMLDARLQRFVAGLK